MNRATVGECIVCGGTEAARIYPGIFRCQECGYVFAELHLSDAALGELYRKDYFFGDEYKDYVADKRVIQRNFARRLQVLRRFRNRTEHRRLLEVGSAYGFFLELARSEFDAVLGIDITEDGVHYARTQLGLNVIQSDIAQHDFGHETFDVVCLWDTIEHLRSPDRCLERVSRYMPQGSLLALTTGDIESLNARLRKAKWRLLHPPTHLHYFSKRTLARMLERFGFDVIYSRYCGFYRSVDSVAYVVLVLRQRRADLYERLRRTRLLRWDLYVNLYDIVYVIARKR